MVWGNVLESVLEWSVNAEAHVLEWSVNAEAHVLGWSVNAEAGDAEALWQACREEAGTERQVCCIEGLKPVGGTAGQTARTEVVRLKEQGCVSRPTTEVSIELAWYILLVRYTAWLNAWLC